MIWDKKEERWSLWMKNTIYICRFCSSIDYNVEYHCISLHLALALNTTVVFNLLVCTTLFPLQYEIVIVTSYLLYDSSHSLEWARIIQILTKLAIINSWRSDWGWSCCPYFVMSFFVIGFWCHDFFGLCQVMLYPFCLWVDFFIKLPWGFNICHMAL